MEYEIKGLVFDFDGVIIASTIEGLERFRHVAELLDLEVTDAIMDHVRGLWGKPATELVKEFWPYTDAEIFKNVWDRYDSQNPISLFPGIKDALTRLSQTFTLGLLTSRDFSTHFQLRHHGLTPLFTYVQTLSDCPLPKPHPSSIKPLLEKYKRKMIDMRNIVFIGDSTHSDFCLAKEIGMNFIGVTWGQATREDFQRAGLRSDYIVDSVPDLLHLLGK